MTLAELRRAAVRKNLRIRFHLSNGMECVLDRHGVARIPALQGSPDFRLEDELSSVRIFTIEAGEAGQARRLAGPRELTSAQLAELAGSADSAEAEHED